MSEDNDRTERPFQVWIAYLPVFQNLCLISPKGFDDVLSFRTLFILSVISDDCMHLVYHLRRNYKPGEVIKFAFESLHQVLVSFSYVADEMYSPDRLGMPPACFMNVINEYGVVMSSNCIGSREPDRRCPDDDAIFYTNQAQIETEWDLSCDNLLTKHTCRQLQSNWRTAQTLLHGLDDE